MNNGNESEKDSVNILSNNRGSMNHNVFLAFVPVFLLWGGFIIFLLLVGLLVFFIVNRAGFLAFMPGVFTGAIELGKWTAIIVLAGLVIKFVFGSAIRDVFAPLSEILLRVWNETRKSRVVHSRE